MKLKILPPTLRKNYRYLTLDIKSTDNLDKEELLSIVWDGSIRFWGECSTSDFSLWIMKLHEIDKNDDYINYKAILRCQRGFEEKLRAALTCIREYKNKKIAINVLGLSGTIESSIKKHID